MAPPKPDETVQLSFPLIDFRSEVLSSSSDYTNDSAFMSRHGFTAVKHKSAITDCTGFQKPETLREIYYPEVEDLVKRVTGCKTVVVTNSTCRGGNPPAAPDGSDIAAYKGARDAENVASMGKAWHRPVIGQPIRLPHCDSTALGGRQSVRAWMTNLTECAAKAGILGHEDGLCNAAGVDPRDEASCDVIDKAYNDHGSGQLGPRYAVFSIWRPIAEVTRDPLALTPWSDAITSDDFVVEPYLNRVQGIQGDWLKELAMLKVKPDVLERKHEPNLKWYHVSNMQPDEVLFVKMFDTAGLGESTGEELGC